MGEELRTGWKPSTISNKLGALDSLDRLALNPSGWFPESVLTDLTRARVAIITERWSEALLSLESARTSVLEFIKVLRGSPESHEDRASAIQRAEDELQQFVYVLAWIDKRPEA